MIATQNRSKRPDRHVILDMPIGGSPSKLMIYNIILNVLLGCRGEAF